MLLTYCQHIANLLRYEGLGTNAETLVLVPTAVPPVSRGGEVQYLDLLPPPVEREEIPLLSIRMYGCCRPLHHYHVAC
jgi:hypothetical protein